MPNGMGFGGGVGGAIAQGLQSGFEMGRQIDRDRAQGEQQKIDNARRDAADARQQITDDRLQKSADLAAAHQSLAASQLQRGELASEGAQYLQQYGGADKIPVDVANNYAQRSSAARQSHEAILKKLIGPVQDQRQQAEDDASKMATGEINPQDPKYPASRLVSTLTATARRPLTDFMSTGDSPAPVKQMIGDFRAGLQTNNEGLTLKALNGLFAPELKTGVGHPSPHGGQIVGKQIVKLLPAPPDPNNPDGGGGKVTPVIRVFVREGGPDAGVGEQRQMANNEQQQFGAPPGATGHYDAPVTQNRSTDPDDPIAHISMEDAFNKIGQMETLATALEHPDMRAKVEQGMKEAGDRPQTFLNALYSVGGTMPTKIQSYENVPIGVHGTVRITKNAQGQETGRETLAPVEGTEKVGALGRKMQDIDASTLSDADKANAKRVAALGVKGSGLGGAAAVAGKSAAPVASDKYKTDTKYKEQVDFWAELLANGGKLPPRFAQSGAGKEMYGDIVRVAPDKAGSANTMLSNQAELAGAMAGSRAVGTRTANFGLAKAEAYSMADLVTQASANVPRTSFVPVNRALLAYEKNSGDVEVRQFGAAINSFINAYARAVSPIGTPTVGDKEHAREMLSTADSHQQVTGIISQLKKEMEAAGAAPKVVRQEQRDAVHSLKGDNAGNPSKAAAVTADEDALINKYLKK